MKYSEIQEGHYHHYACVYELSFPDGSFYVGQTEGLGKRLTLYAREARNGGHSTPVNDAIREFGMDSMEITVLAAPQNLSKEDNALARAILEVKYIRELKATEGKGLNRVPGGEILGLAVSTISTNASNKRRGLCPVVVYSVAGDYVADYATVPECATALGVTPREVESRIDKNTGAILEKYMVRRRRGEEIPLKIEPLVKKREPYYTPREKDTGVRYRQWSQLINDFKIGQYTLDGELVAEFGSINEASHKTGIAYSGIWSCVFGRTKRAGKFFWKKIG